MIYPRKKSKLVLCCFDLLLVISVIFPYREWRTLDLPRLYLGSELAALVHGNAVTLNRLTWILCQRGLLAKREGLVPSPLVEFHPIAGGEATTNIALKHNRSEDKGAIAHSKMRIH